MQKTILTLSILLFLILQSCNNSPDCCPIPVEDIETNTPDTVKNNTTQVSIDKINFNDLKVGQTSVYVRQKTSNWQNESDTLTLTTDTIQLKIVSQDELGFKVEEWRFNSYSNNNYYYFKIVNNSLQVTPISIPNFSSFFIPQEHILTFNEQVLQKWVLNKWLIPSTQLFRGSSQGFIDSTTINGIKYGKTLGRFDLSLTPGDGPILVQLYSKSSGFICFQSLGSYFVKSGSLWMLIP